MATTQTTTVFCPLFICIIIINWRRDHRRRKINVFNLTCGARGGGEEQDKERASARFHTTVHGNAGSGFGMTRYPVVGGGVRSGPRIRDKTGQSGKVGRVNLKNLLTSWDKQEQCIVSG